MGGSSPIDPTAPGVTCQRCGQKFAAVRFVEDLFSQPPMDLLLCGECWEAESGRLVGRMLKATGTDLPDGFPDNLGDEALRDFFRRFQDPAHWE